MAEQHDIKSIVLSRVNKKYPSWTGFSDPRFVEEEIAYKRQASDLAKDRLNEESLQNHIDAEEYGQIFDSVFEVAKATNLLYLSTPSTGDASNLLSDELDKASYCQQLLDLLHGTGPSHERLDRYWSFIEEQGLNPKWQLPTYLLFLFHPGHDILIKPRHTNNFLKIVGDDLRLGQPNGEQYERVRRLLYDLKEQISGLESADMIGAQSLLYIVVKTDVAGKTLAKPFSDIFESWEQAEWAFDLLKEVVGALGVSNPDDERLAATVPSQYNQRVLRLNFGNLVAIDFSGPDGYYHGVTFVTDDQFGIDDPRFHVWTDKFADLEGLHYVSASFDEIQETEDELLPALINGARQLGKLFRDWSRSNLRFAHIQSLIDAAFEPDVREHLLNEGITLSDLPVGEGPFTSRTFELLSMLEKNPTRELYNEHKDDFKTFVEEPVRDLFASVAERLPTGMKEYLETEKGLFGRIPKNDYGRGGAWPYYWGAFFPEGGKRIRDSQLFISIYPERLNIGFYIGDYGTERRSEFARRLSRRSGLARVLREWFGDQDFLFGGDDGSGNIRNAASWDEWVNNLDEYDIRVWKTKTPEEAIATSHEELVDWIYHSFVALFPLMYVVEEGDPEPKIRAFIDESDTVDPDVIHPEYTRENCANETGFESTEIGRWLRAIERKGQGILYGPPGTGKTYVAERLARVIVSETDGLIEMLQFHPSYSYEEFMEGIRPKTDGSGNLSYELVAGRFLGFCREAEEREGRCVLLIDEINRANLSRVFGELMYLLEYRDETVPLAAGTRFRIPKNVRILGTMNTADRSIALVDHALRRRFAFIPLYPNYDVLRRFHAETGFNVNGLITRLRALNTEIGDPDYEVGISYFLNPRLDRHIEDVWRMEIEPYLEEYFFDQRKKVEKYRWDEVKTGILGANDQE